MDGDEWNTTALGPENSKRADILALAGSTTASPQVVCFTIDRANGIQASRAPLGNGDLLAEGWLTSHLARYGADGGRTGARTFAGGRFPGVYSRARGAIGRRSQARAPLATRIPRYYLWKERRSCLSNVSPRDSKLANEQDRKRLAQIFEQGLKPRRWGYALPLRREYYTDGSNGWESGAWFLRSEEMFLVPGDSPMGYRLPLDSIPWVKESEYPHLYEQDPTAERSPLPHRTALSANRHVPGAPEARDPQGFVDAGDVDRACFRGAHDAKRAQPTWRRSQANRRPGSFARRFARKFEVVLRVFMPPQHYLEDYIELVAAIEDTAAQLGLSVLIEGYTPPQDSRLHVIRVTPDPGVIEVNTHPARSWDELVKNTTTLYEEARLSRLATEKFMIDGRHTGTGGGNHILVGGPTPADSPLLRNPGLLRSLVGYWHNHSALSYLFSGLFVGPTSQAPRVDEARNDQVYELEIAFNGGARRRADPSVDSRSHLPQLIDRRLWQHAPRGILH